MSVDVDRHLAVQAGPHPSLEQKFGATHALRLEVVYVCAGPFLVFVEAKHGGG